MNLYFVTILFSDGGLTIAVVQAEDVVGATKAAEQLTGKEDTGYEISMEPINTDLEGQRVLVTSCRYDMPYRVDAGGPAPSGVPVANPLRWNENPRGNK